MSFLTEYFDEYRQHRIRRTPIFRPENRYAKLEGKWLDPKVGSDDKELTHEEIEAFIKKTMKSMRGQSTYYNAYCAHLSPEFKYRKFKPREKKKVCKAKDEEVEETSSLELPKPLALKDTEVMKVAQALYERDMEKPTLEPLPTHFRRIVLIEILHASEILAEVLGYVRPCLYKTGISEYTESIARLAYEVVRDGRVPRYHRHNGCRPLWGLPPEGTRQPPLDGAPFDGERLY